jgi:hypothetical protein
MQIVFVCSHLCADMIELGKRGKRERERKKEKDIMFRFIRMSLEKLIKKIDFHIY